MANIYVDASTGNDTTGTIGNPALPYQTIAKAVSICNGGDFIMLSNVAAFVLTTAIVWTGAGATTAISNLNPLTIMAWNNGGSLTISNPVANVLAAEIDGNSAAADIFSTSSQPGNVNLIGLKMHGTTSSVLSISGAGWEITNCEIYSGGSTVSTISLAVYGIITNTYIHNDNATASTAGAISITNTSGIALINNCYILGKTRSIRLGTLSSVIIQNNIIIAGTTAAIDNGSTSTSALVIITGNTLIGTGTASQTGLLTGASSGRTQCYNNIIAGFSGTSSVGVSVTSGGSFGIFGNNSYYNNTTNTSGVVIKGVDLTANDKVETSNPFTNTASANYGLVTGALSLASATPAGFNGSGTLNYQDRGAAQAQATGGGSTATTASAYVN